MNKFFLPLCFVVFASIFMGCANQKITFYGKVYSGTYDSTTGLVAVGAPISGAVVKERNNAVTTLTDSSGNFQLEIEVPGVIGTPNAKAYVIESTFNGSGDYDVVYARPGERVYVRDMVLYQLVPDVSLSVPQFKR